MIKSLNRRLMNQAIQSHDVQLKTFGGAKIEDMRDYVMPTLRARPEALILHCGTNNLKNENEERLANKIVALAVDIKRRCHKPKNRNKREHSLLKSCGHLKE